MKCPAVAAAMHWRSRPGNRDLVVFDYEDALQEARIALHQNPEAGEKVLYRRILDAARQAVPGYRDRAMPTHVSEDNLQSVASGYNTEADAARNEQLRRVPASIHKEVRRSMESRTLARAIRMADAAAGKMERASSDSFDPGAVIIEMNVTRTGRANKNQALIARMPATGSVVLARTQAESLRTEMKRMGVRYMTQAVSETLVRVWREPSAEQIAIKKGKR